MLRRGGFPRESNGDGGRRPVSGAPIARKASSERPPAAHSTLSALGDPSSFLRGLGIGKSGPGQPPNLYKANLLHKIRASSRYPEREDCRIGGQIFDARVIPGRYQILTPADTSAYGLGTLFGRRAIEHPL